MFTKRPTKGGLADRVRHVAERKTPVLPPQPVSPPRKQEERGDRRSVFRQAAVIFDTGQSMRVAIKNLSDTGARIEFLSMSDLPDYLILHEPTLGVRRRARVVWQRAGIAGLQFID